ncbi:MAG: hypothetical protein QOI58_1231 [Thermoanaerobaculia bacterium]|jgi:hypothetical protein|nr:hypothetical protein [Thermoanaerobaculia bacterium]
MHPSDDNNRIRAIFLHPEPRVTVAEAAHMLGWSSGRLNEAMRDGEIEVAGTCRSSSVDVAELVEMALSLWPVTQIERALGSSARKILPPGLRTRTLCRRLPRYLIDMLQQLAAAERTSLELFLSRELQNLASARRETLARELPGFAEAFDWPRRNETQPNC